MKMKLFTKFYELIDILKNINNTLNEIKQLLKHNNTNVLPIKNDSYKFDIENDFIPSSNVNDFNIINKSNKEKKIIIKDFSKISKKIKEE